jgi:uncharacterized protein (DUF1015 family)
LPPLFIEINALKNFMKIKPFQAVYPKLDFLTSPDAFFARVKFEYPEYKKNGFFNKTAQEAIYIYEIEAKHRTYTGLLACSDVQDYYDGNIKKHENTISTKEQQQMQLVISRGAVVKPVLLTYHGVDEINELIYNYKKNNTHFFEISFLEDQQLHRVWEISDATLINTFQALFADKIPQTYIADGHHRVSTLALMHKRIMNKMGYSNFNSVLSAFFPTDQLEVLDFNRVVKGLNGHSPTTFMAKIAQLFDTEIINLRKPSKKYEIVMFFNNEWFQLTWKKEILASYKNTQILLDASMLNEKVMKGILGIEDSRTDTRVNYIQGVKGLEDFRLTTLKSEQNIGFCLYPVALTDIIAMADMGKTMPPKSTWFEPRMKNGLVAQEFD